MTDGTTPADPAEARKRRKAIIESQRLESETAAAAATENSAQNQSSAPAPSTQEESSAAPSSEDALPPKKRKVEKKKTQIRYDPDVPMSKEQLAAWRREARRVRNRESAAASRQRIRNRITELETEVEGWKSKYNQAMERLQELENVAAAQADAGNSSTKV